MALRQDDFRQLHERSLPQRCAGRIYLFSGPDYGSGKLAYVPGPDQAIRAHGMSAPDKAPIRCRKSAYLVGRQRGEPLGWSAADRSFALGAGSNPISVGRTAARRSWKPGFDWDQLGNCRGRKWKGRPSNERRMGP